MTDSTFDPQTFLSSAIDAPIDTSRVNIPAGDWPATAEKLDMKAWSSKDGSKSGQKLQIVWNIDDPTVNAATGRDKNQVRQEIMLDLDESGTKLAGGKGKNRSLGILYDALAINQPGVTPQHILGRMAKVRVTQREYNGSLYDEVKEVTRLA